MKSPSRVPFFPSWSPQDIANAVPLRLFELLAFDASITGVARGRSANREARRPLHGGYVRRRELPALVRVRS